MKSILKILTIIILCKTSFAIGQNQSNVDPRNFNKQYLEHLVKIKVDEVRKKNSCKPLINDSILYVAANHHAKYMKSKASISHDEYDSILTKTPQKRAEYFGAVNYVVGENVLWSKYNAVIKSKTGDLIDTHTYEGLADAMVSGWVNSPGHFKNIINSEYQITGLSISIDTVNHKVYACQKFARVMYKYSFTENKSLFPYSKYVPEPLVNSFDGIPNQLINYKYDYDLKHDDSTKCQKCKELVRESPMLSLRIENNNFILRVENSEYVKELLNSKSDGFAVEIVSFDDYMCGNPEYFTKPSRRNGQLKLNGKILEPLYRSDLIKGFKKRTKGKDLKFVSYLFNADSVSFFKRFGKYKIERYDYKYFEISLGKVPKGISGLWAHNLVYIQNEQICHIDYFTSYCGELYSDCYDSDFIPDTSTANYSFTPVKRQINFTIPFEKAKSVFTEKDIQPFIESVGNLSYQIDSILIKAFTSIEGDSILNTELQYKRAENIVKVLKAHQNENFPVRVVTSSDWKGFYAAVKNNIEWNYLAKLQKNEIIKELDKVGYEKIEPLLAKGRRGEIKINSTVPVDDGSIEFYVKKELLKLDSALQIKKNPSENASKELESFDRLYTFIHQLVITKKLKAQLLADIQMPLRYKDSYSLLQKFIMYGYEFEDEFKKNKAWVENHKADELFMLNNYYNRCSPQFIYNISRNATNNFIRRAVVTEDEVQRIINYLDKLSEFYQANAIAKKNIDILNFNLNCILISKAFINEPEKHSVDASMCMTQIINYYKQNNAMNAQIALALAKCAIFYHDNNKASEILQPFHEDESVIAFLMEISYSHISEDYSKSYYQNLLKLSNEMNLGVWCNMFMGECKIPFQVFDESKIRNAFCEKCLDKNEFLIELINKKP